jgi:hypothetical protein
MHLYQVRLVRRGRNAESLHKSERAVAIRSPRANGVGKRHWSRAVLLKHNVGSLASVKQVRASVRVQHLVRVCSASRPPRAAVERKLMRSNLAELPLAHVWPFEVVEDAVPHARVVVLPQHRVFVVGARRHKQRGWVPGGW